ncbi:TPA: WXG100 family type VII secretion target [Bacillus paranthracis]|uniref:WXG100 family type VII secretion target n=1 Tax=Bacillus paranthracis TaxID=2026186 RepID=A0AAJ1K0N6_9BACI|nr:MULTISPECIES: WXG100 family type VII secretion target [Bacillus]MDA1586084.1 WXG100 family type VII secretion target [Bacillus cereus group sp. TH230-1LC]RAT04737.1 type VII secretion protein [Bacillus cereus]MBG9907706.1 type VII secretion protein [Bacillus paranthracis]MDG0946087.1 WXG100 family type VII secretion target [Bacillus paranthracis]MDG0952491.1 WXG100 family type VII secretion target [Bacillus paranthracis]
MVQIKVTPERLEQVAKTVKNVRYTLEQIHNGLYNQTEHIAANWAGATSQHFYQMFNEAKPKMFTVLTEFDKIADELERVAEKFRMADTEYDGNLVESEIIANTPSSENNNTSPGVSSSKKDGESLEKVTRDLVGELSGEYDVRRVIEGIDPDTGEKLSWWERTGAGVMVFAGLTPVGKGIKVVKGAKKVSNAIDAAATLEKQRKTLKANSLAGKEYETKMFEVIKQQKPKSELNEQITVQTKSGVRTRIDIGGKDANGKIDLVELKSSPTAPLTKNQKKAFPEIAESGAIVKSRNKPPFEHLEEIPPTKINVIRKE